MPDIAKRVIGGTEVSVTELGFGGVGLGQRVDVISEAQAEATLNAALDAGVAYFDTSPWYGHCLSEHRTGHVLRTRPRGSFVLSTKVGRLFFRPEDPDRYTTAPWCEGLPFDYRFDYTAAGIRRSYEDSLHRLGLNKVDLLFVHDLDERLEDNNSHTQGVGGIAGAIEQLDRGGGWQVLADMRARGEIGGVGFGINNVGFIPRFLERFDPDMFLVAMPYTLMDQDALDEELPLCAEKGIGVVIGSVFSSGVLATGARDDAVYGYQPPPPEIVAKLSGMEAVCTRHAVPLRAAALQFPLLHPAVASIIPGAMAPEHVTENAALLNQPIPTDFWAELKAEGLLRADAPTA
ncbi:MAG: aldo/keto reductase [Alphaproteobacteria bacterium]|nr:aldo/keto reductase [Alphaproteobacteria bacterium]